MTQCTNDAIRRAAPPVPPVAVLLRHGLQPPREPLHPDPVEDRRRRVAVLSRQVRAIEEADVLPPWDDDDRWREYEEGAGGCDAELPKPASPQSEGRRWTTGVRDSDGRRFDSVEAAADHHMVDRVTVFHAISSGKPCRVFDADGQPTAAGFRRTGPRLVGRKPARPKPVRIVRTLFGDAPLVQRPRGPRRPRPAADAGQVSLFAS